MAMRGSVLRALLVQQNQHWVARRLVAWRVVARGVVERRVVARMRACQIPLVDGISAETVSLRVGLVVERGPRLS
ncbi:MAG: hypothetical protein AB8C13_04610 [Phycisphaerales bacterium]